MEKLIVRNFGAIRDVEIELKALTIFIGESGTGKSTLAKLISIFRSAKFWLETIANSDNSYFFKEKLAHYQIDNFFEENTYIHYCVQVNAETNVSFTYDKSVVSANFYEKVLKIAASSLSNNDGDIDKTINTVRFVANTWFNEVIYMPADRGAVDFLEKMLTVSDDNLRRLFPRSLSNFVMLYSSISASLNSLHIALFDVSYKKLDGKNYIELPNGKSYLLSEAASGMQTAIPVIIVLEYFSQSKEKKSYTIEEPELNLFPTAQKALVEFFAEKVLGCGHELVITTHSPYILTSLNNLLFASRIVEKYPDARNQLDNILSMKRFVSESQVCVYELLFDNKQVSCTENSISKKTGVIPENILDRSSDCIMGTFNSLMGIYREFRRTTN
jgi:predicted ATPase